MRPRMFEERNFEAYSVVVSGSRQSATVRAFECGRAPSEGGQFYGAYGPYDSEMYFVPGHPGSMGVDPRP